jgi:hypothetical protein
MGVARPIPICAQPCPPPLVLEGGGWWYRAGDRKKA